MQTGSSYTSPNLFEGKRLWHQSRHVWIQGTLFCFVNILFVLSAQVVIQLSLVYAPELLTANTRADTLRSQGKLPTSQRLGFSLIITLLCEQPSNISFWCNSNLLVLKLIQVRWSVGQNRDWWREKCATLALPVTEFLWKSKVVRYTEVINQLTVSGPSWLASFLPSLHTIIYHDLGFLCDTNLLPIEDWEVDVGNVATSTKKRLNIFIFQF